MIKDEIINYINKNYDKLLQVANYITNDETAGDLLNNVLLNILTRKNYSKLIKECKPNFFGYIFKAMFNQYYSKTSLYYKQFRIYKPVLDIFEDIEIENNKNKIDKIIKFVNETDLYEDEMKEKLKNLEESKHKKIINKYKLKNKVDKELFFMYFFPEKYIDIKNLSINEVNNIRKTSYRKITKKIGISYSSVSISINKVIKKINDNLDQI